MSAGCDYCAKAAGEFHHFMRGDCRGCAARTAARSQPFFESRVARVWTDEYRNLLDRLGVTHDEVLAAARIDRLAKGKA